MRRLRILVVAAALFGGVVAPSASFAAASSGRLAPTCFDSAVAVSLSVVRGSQGAGQTSYALRVKNVSSQTCRTGGLAELVLLGRRGARLPTSVTVACGNCAALVLSVKPGTSAWADARFSPDVPGLGESHPGQCESTAYEVRVTLPGTTGAALGRIRPPTPVCSRGAIRLSYFSAVKPST